MAILGFHFSGVYNEVLINGNKTATIMTGENYFRIGQDVLVYLSEKPGLFEGEIEKRIDKAVIKEIKIKRIKDLEEYEAKFCGSRNLEDIKSALKNWYNSEDNSIITYIKFDLELND